MSKIIITYAKARYEYMEIKERSSGKERRGRNKLSNLEKN